MSCCKNNLGRFPHNEDIKFGVNAAQAGEHKFLCTAMNFTEFVIKKTFAIGEEITIPKLKLCEDFLYTVQVKQPDDTLLLKDACENFLIQTYISINTICEDEYYDV